MSSDHKVPHGTIPPLVVAHLERHPESTPTEISDAIGHKASAVKRALGTMKKNGDVESDKFGRYWLPESARVVSEPRVPFSATESRAFERRTRAGAAFLFTLDAGGSPVAGYDLNSGRFVQIGTPPGVPYRPVSSAVDAA